VTFWEVLRLTVYVVGSVLLLKWGWDIIYPRARMAQLDGIKTGLAKDLAAAQVRKASVIQVQAQEGLLPLLIGNDPALRILDPATGRISDLAGQIFAQHPELESLNHQLRIAQATRGTNAHVWGEQATPELEMPWPYTPGLMEYTRTHRPSEDSLVLGQTRDGAFVTRGLSGMMHSLAAGSTSQGKTTWIISLLAQLALADAEIEVVAIDVHGSGFNILSRWDKMLCSVARSSSEAKSVMSELILGELSRRRSLYMTYPSVTSLGAYNRVAKKPLKTRLCIIDEGTIMMNRGGLQNLLWDTVEGGRQFGVYVMMSVQSANYDTVATQARGQFRTRWVSWMEDQAAKAALGVNPPGPLPTEPGRAWMALDGGRVIQQVQGLYVSPEDALQVFQGNGNVVAPPAPVVQEIVDTDAELRRLVTQEGKRPADALREVFHRRPNGRDYHALARPFVESAKTAPLGPPPPNGAVAFVTRALDNSVRLHYNAVDDWTRLDRFLVLGSEKSTYYVQARELTRRTAEAVLRCIGNDGRRSHRRDQPGTWRSPFEHRAWQ